MNRYELDYELDCSQHLKLVDEIFDGLISKYSIEDIMNIVRENKDYTVYISLNRSNPWEIDIVIDKEGRFSYRCDEDMMIPIPKKFAVLEPDKKYFEMTLKANIFLAVIKADKRELHF
ncbi:MAG TPA: hypothetical protein EYH04_01765 [Archaeoglobus profundus]|nr:hypothetical protein [Archaeoglobus profundus]